MTDDETWEKLQWHLDSADPTAILYVYRVDARNQLQKPFLLKESPWPQLPDYLRDECGGGDFRILIRHGRTMVFRGDISIGAPPLKMSR